METRNDKVNNMLARIKAMLKQLRLTGITRYNDVEEGRLVLTVGQHTKSWRAVWLSQLRLNSRGPRNLPRGDFTLRYGHRGLWIDCPKIRLSLKSSAWIEPLGSLTWEGMGTNVYLLSDKGWPDSISIADYKQLVSALTYYGINAISIDKPERAVDGFLCRTGEIMGMEAFWENRNQ